MHNSTCKTLLTAEQEVNYLRAYINQYKSHYTDMARIVLHINIEPCSHYIEHDMLLPLINDAFRFGILRVEQPVIMFDLQLNKQSLTFGVHYHVNTWVYDERTQVAFLKMKNKLESLYPGRHILYRDYYQDTYLVLLKIQFA